MPPSRWRGSSARSRWLPRPIGSSPPPPTSPTSSSPSTAPIRAGSARSRPASISMCSPRARRTRRGPGWDYARTRSPLLFVGRIQPLKGPDVLLRAAAVLNADPSLTGRLQVIVLGAPSGSGLAHPHHLMKLRDELGLRNVVEFRPPAAREVVADYYRAADLTVVPSHNESFGLVALESQACGTPVVAAAVGGLPTAVANDVSGVLVDGHDPELWAKVIADLLRTPSARADPRSARATARGALLVGADRRRAARRISRRRAGEPRPGAAVSAAEVIAAALDEQELEWQRLGDMTFAVALPGERAAQDRLRADGRCARAGDRGVRHAGARREPRARVSVAAAAQCPDVCGVVDRRRCRRCVPDRPRAALRRSQRTRSTGFSAACSNTPTGRSTSCSRWASARPSGANGRGASRMTCPGRTSLRSPISQQRPLD